MKKLSKLILLSLFILNTGTSFSQSSDQLRPKLFANYPDDIALSENTLQNTFNATTGKEISISFNNNFLFTGTVISNVQKYDNLKCVMIRSAIFGNAVFQLSEITNEDKHISYAGRIINPDAFDGYEIKKDINNNYHFQKFETGKILEPCSY